MTQNYLRFSKDYLDAKRLDSVAYRNAKPFPLAVIDDFLPNDFLHRVIAEIPDGQELGVRDNESTKGKSAVYRSEIKILHDSTYHLVSEMNSVVFLDFLVQMTGIEGLIPDPYVHCGGIHQTRKHGYLGLHADYNFLGELRLDRQLNVLLYLNEVWQDSWEGNLELWDENLEGCVECIAPIANRLVIFSTSDTSWHGRMKPLAVPEGVTRNSLAM